MNTQIFMGKSLNTYRKKVNSTDIAKLAGVSQARSGVRE